METLVRSDREFYVRFWGVRKGTPVCEPQFLRYGGNTSCIEVRCGNQLFIFDTGTGCRYFGNSLDEGSGIDADVFFTRTNFEHVCGLPFFKPAFLPTNSFKFFAGHLLPDVGIQSRRTWLTSGVLRERQEIPAVDVLQLREQRRRRDLPQQALLRCCQLHPRWGLVRDEQLRGRADAPCMHLLPNLGRPRMERGTFSSGQARARLRLVKGRRSIRGRRTAVGAHLNVCEVRLLGRRFRRLLLFLLLPAAR